MKFPLARLAGVMAVAIALSGGVSWGGDFYFPRFDTDSGLKLLEHAALYQGKVRISPAIPGWGLGGVWLREKQPVKYGFRTTFQIQITDKHSSGADGMAFVIQNGDKPALGQTGQGLGYGGLTNQFVIHFDNYHWGDHPTAGRYDEIAVLAAASPTTPLYNVNSNILAAVNRQVNYSDGAVHTVKIVYVPGNLQVYLDDLENPLMTVYVNLAQVMNLEHGRAWVGFTASAGADWQNHDLVSWRFDSGENMVPTPTPAIPTNTPIYLGKDVSQATLTALPNDPAFGYALPGDVHMTKRIMVSTNLMQWETLTNASYYFRDQDSTNHPQRFYRFESD